MRNRHPHHSNCPDKILSLMVKEKLKYLKRDAGNHLVLRNTQSLDRVERTKKGGKQNVMDERWRKTSKVDGDEHYDTRLE